MKSACLSSNRLETSPWSRSLQTRLLCHILRLHLHQSKVIVKSLKIVNWPLALISIIAFFCPEGRFICLWRTFPYCTRQIIALVTRKNICCDPHPVSWTFFLCGISYGIIGLFVIFHFINENKFITVVWQHFSYYTCVHS